MTDRPAVVAVATAKSAPTASLGARSPAGRDALPEDLKPLTPSRRRGRRMFARASGNRRRLIHELLAAVTEEEEERASVRPRVGMNTIV